MHPHHSHLDSLDVIAEEHAEPQTIELENVCLVLFEGPAADIMLFFIFQCIALTLVKHLNEFSSVRTDDDDDDDDDDNDFK